MDNKGRICIISDNNYNNYNNYDNFIHLFNFDDLPITFDITDFVYIFRSKWYPNCKKIYDNFSYLFSSFDEFFDLYSSLNETQCIIIHNNKYFCIKSKL